MLRSVQNICQGDHSFWVLCHNISTKSFDHFWLFTLASKPHFLQSMNRWQLFHSFPAIFDLHKIARQLKGLLWQFIWMIFEHIRHIENLVLLFHI